MSYQGFSRIFNRFGALGSRGALFLGFAGITTAITLVLRYTFSKDPQFIQNLAIVGRLVNDKKQLPETANDFDEFDVIIVGGGTAGCVLASRLSEDPSIRVLLLEAGGSGMALPLSRIPSGFGKLFRTKHVFNFRTEPQIFANGKTNYWPRAKLLGGCSSINAQMAQYGAPGDFDEWAKAIGDKSWSWKEFGSYFRKFERFISDPLYPLVDASVRGSQGPMRVGYFNYVSKASKEFIIACTNVGIPFIPDFNGPAGPIGVSRMMTYIDENRERVSTEAAYLTEHVLARPNLKVAIHSQVTQVLFEKINDQLQAVGVEFANSRNGPRYRARARKEVVLAAGAIHSPHILMLSGVGPVEHLKDHGIPIVHDLPGVGSKLVDHPVIDLYFKDKLKLSAKFMRPKTASDTVRFILTLFQYRLFRQGPLATNFGESAAFCRSDDPILFPPSEYPEKPKDSASGPDSPDLEIFTTPMAFKEHGLIGFDIHTFSIHAYLLRPTSHGAVRLTSSSPWINPSMNPNYCQTQEDVEKLKRGARLCLKIARTEPLASHLDLTDLRPDLDNELHLKTDAELEAIVRDRVETVYHPTSTCRMAPQEDGGVVDAKLRVYGIPNLRVCDASIFPFIVSGHTAGACIAVAEKLADVLKAELDAGRID